MLIASMSILAGCGNNEKIAYVDTVKIQQESTKAHEIEDKIKAKQEDVGKRLEAVKAKGNEEEYTAAVQKANQEMSIYSKAMAKEMESYVDGNLGQIAKDGGYTLVVDKYANISGGTDITEQVLDKIGRYKADETKASTSPDAGTQTGNSK